MTRLASMLTSNPRPLPVEAFCLSWGQFSIPLVFVAPFVLTGKKILQDLCRLKLGWDDEVPAEHGLRWQRWLMDIPKLSQFTIKRCLKPADFKSTVSSQLHHFSDPSEIGFGSVSYLRLEDDCGRIYCTILQGKSRLVPLKQINNSSPGVVGRNSLNPVG